MVVIPLRNMVEGNMCLAMAANSYMEGKTEMVDSIFTKGLVSG
jgi:hypothetical protein